MVTIRHILVVLILCISLPLFSADEEKPKNVRVLKNLSRADLLAAMTFIRTSLGVRCDYCHVMTDTKRDMASDEKKTKLIARKMISMVLDLNRNDFNNRPEVSCYTCHQGHTKPVSLPPLPIPVTPATTFISADALTSPPTPAEIVQKYVEALGGKDAIGMAQNAKTIIWKATREGAEGKPSSMEVYQEKPHKIALVSDSARGRVLQIQNGKTGWIKDQDGVAEMDPADLDRFHSNVAFYQIVQLNTDSSSVQLRGKDTISDHEVFVLQQQLDEKLTERYYVDVNSGLLLRKVTLQRTPIGIIPQQYDFDDYRDWKGIKLPFMIHVTAADAHGSGIVKISDIEMNVPIDPLKFEKP